MIHCYLFGFFPILYIYINNSRQVVFLHAIVFIVAICLFTFGASKALSIIFKNNKNAIYLFISCSYLLFWFAHPIALEASKHLTIPQFVATYKWALLLMLVVFFEYILVVFLKKSNCMTIKINKCLNVFSIILFLLMISTLCKGYNVEASHKTVCNKITNSKLPNIYHILLDAYVNLDTAKNLYNYDNSYFYGTLESIGFVCYPSSTSNYAGTLLSTSSMLNFGEKHSSLETENDFLKKLKFNKVWLNLKEKGYNIELFSQTELYDDKSFVLNKLNISSWTKSIMIFTQKTPIKHIIENIFLYGFYKQHIDEIYSILNLLKSGSETSGYNNQYFYAHILNPHEPMVFNETGGIESKQTFDGFLLQKQTNIASNNEERKCYSRRYVNQIKALNKLVLNMINDILSQYDDNNQPIIILHGDHGRTLSVNDDHMHNFSNLFAIYVPNDWRNEAKSLQFVNLYRFIFSKLFN